MVPGFRVVSEQSKRTTVAADEQIDVPVVVVVAKQGSTTHLDRIKGRAALGGDVSEASVDADPEESVPQAYGFSGRSGRSTRITEPFTSSISC